MTDEHKFYGNHRAKVLATDAAEDENLGRIKVEVYPMLIGVETAKALRKQGASTVGGIETADLPWCMPAMPLSLGAGHYLDDNDDPVYTGSFNVPDPGTFVWVFFEAGDVYQPIYFAEAQTATEGLPESRGTNYPKRRVIKYKHVEVIIDDHDYEDSDDDSTHSDVIINISRNASVNISQDAIIHVVRDALIDVDRNVTADIEGNLSAEVEGDTLLDAVGNVDVAADGDVNISGASVNIN